MNNKLISFVLATSICLTPVSNIFAKTFDAKTGVALDKTWTIRLNNQLSNGGDYSGITIKDSNGKAINISIHIEPDRKSICINAPDGYLANTTYTLTVTGIKDINNNEIQSTKMQFTTVARANSNEPLLIIAQPKGPGINVYSGIKTLYGDHDYGCKSQAEYDAVIAKVKQAILDANANMQLDPYIARYDNGERSAYTSGADAVADYRAGKITLQQYKDARGLASIQKLDGTFLDSTDKEYHVSMIKARGIASNFENGVNFENPNATSAYDVLFNHITKCDAESQTFSAVLDMLGYNTAVIGGGGDAKCKVQVNNQWWDAGGLFKDDINGDWVSAPTYD